MNLLSPLKALASLLVMNFAAGCTHSVHQHYIGSMDSDVSYKSGRWVTASSKDFVILGFQMDTKYVEEAYEELEAKCSGRIAQVTTEHLTSFKFLSYEQKVILKGYCTG